MATQKSFATVAKREFENFLQTTAFKGLQFVKHSVHWSESAFWIVLLVGATVLAVRDVRKVCEEFVNEETYTSMRVVGLQKLTFDDATLCVEFDPRGINGSENFALDTDVAEISRKLNLSSVEILSTSLKLLTAFSMAESGRSVDFRRKVDPLTNDVVQRLHEWLKTEKVDVANLSQIVGNWLCHTVGVRIEITKRGLLIHTVNPCKRTKITWLGVIPLLSTRSTEVAFCLDIGGQISFGNMLERVIINVNANGFFPTSSSSSYPADDDYKLDSFVDFSGDPVTTDMTDNFVLFPISGCSAYRVSVDAEFHLIDRRRARCEPSAKTPLACYGTCEIMRREVGSEACNCIHLAWRHLRRENRSLCFDVHTIEQQLDCRLVARTTDMSEVCWQSCLHPCAQRQLAFTAIAEGCYEADGRSGVSLEFMPKRFSVPIFQEEFAIGVSKLFSSIGGTCGLWLGVGMLGVCHALLFPLKLLTSLLRQGVLQDGDIALSPS